MFLFILVFCQMKIASSHLFVENAADFVDVGYKKSLRLGVLKEDISVIEVSVRLMYMIENIGLIDKHRVSLEIEDDDEGGEWTLAQEAPVIRGGVYSWTEQNHAPCHTHKFRLWVHTKDGSQESFVLPQTIAGLDSSKLISEKYIPKPPSKLEIVETLYALVVSWAPQHCVQFYYLSYKTVSSNTWKSKRVASIDRPSILLTDGVESCAEYEIKIISAIGNSFLSSLIDLCKAV